MRKRNTFGAALAVGLLVAACSSDGTESTPEDPTVELYQAPAQDDEATEIDEMFSFADDDLCEWISEEMLTGLVAGEFDWDGVAVEAAVSPEQVDDEPRGRVACHWELTESSDGHVTIFAPTTLEVGDGLANYDDVAGTLVDQPVLGHPDLSEGVAYFQEPFSRPAFGVPAVDEYLIMDPELIEQHPMFGTGVYWASWFAIADELIAELGWTQVLGSIGDSVDVAAPERIDTPS